MNHLPDQDPFEQSLHQALRRVQPPSSFADSILRQTKRYNLLPFPRPRIWAAAAAAILAAALGLSHHQHAAQQAQAERQFALSEQVTDHAYAQIREHLMHAGVQLDQE